MAANSTSSTVGPHSQNSSEAKSSNASVQPNQIMQISRLQHSVDKLRSETYNLRERLRSEHEAVRALRAQHAAELRNERTAARRRKVELEDQLKSIKHTSFTDAGSSSGPSTSAPKCDQCARIKAEYEADLKQEKHEFKRKEKLLKLQLISHINSQENTSATIGKENCIQCAKIKLEYDAEIRKCQMEFKKKEELLKNQLKENINSTCSSTQPSAENCEQCLRVKKDFEAELKLEKHNFKEKEEMLKSQLKDSQRQISSILSATTSQNNCEKCLRLKLDFDSEIHRERNEFKKVEENLQNQLKEKQKIIEETSNQNLSNCTQCTKVKAEFDAELRKNQQEFKKKEEFLDQQLKEKQNIITQFSASSGSSLVKCEQCTRMKAEYDAELRKQQNESKKKEDLLKAQLKDRSNLNLKSSTIVIANCEQCARMKAEFDSCLRKEKSEFKKKEGLLKSQINDIKKLVGSGGNNGSGCGLCIRYNKEIGKLKETIKDLEERLDKVIEADKLKAADLRTQHEKHVTEMSRITRANKQDAHKLLEELKTKDKIIAQLRKSAGRRKIFSEENYIENSEQMRKLKEELRKSDQPALLPSVTACDLKLNTNLDKFQQNELLERNLPIKTKDEMVSGSTNDELEPSLEEDTDSALSSAPSSLSPQPCSPLNDECHPLRLKTLPIAPVSSSINQLRNHSLINAQLSNINNSNDVTPPPTSLSPQPSEGYTTPPPGLWIINDDEEFNNETTEQASELTIARRQVRELERALLVTRASKQSNHQVLLLENRVRQLEEKEASLLRELSDLREQNELLEFRVLELAEGADKASITTINMFTDNLQIKNMNLDETENTENFIAKKEMKDESINASPDDAEQLLSINNMNDNNVRNKLVEMVYKSDNDEDQKCLLNVLVLLNALDELSRTSTNPFLNYELNEDDSKELNSLNSLTGSNAQIIRGNRHTERDKLVAKVSPFTGRSSTDSDDDKDLSYTLTQKRELTTSCGTQTDVSNEFLSEIAQDKSLNLTAEVRKLDKLRETIEVVGNRHGRLVVSNINDNNICCDQKRFFQRQLDYYQDRVNALERKISIYETTADNQLKHLNEVLNKEIHLEAQIKALSSTIQKLQSDNHRLEEERCELEEAENDTRLRCQHLELELTQLEKSRMSAKRRCKEARSQSTYWETLVNKYEEKNYELEERECELRHRLELLEKTAPQIMLLNMWKTMQKQHPTENVGKIFNTMNSRSRSRSPSYLQSRSPQRESDNSKYQEYILSLEKDNECLLTVKRNLEQMVQDLEQQVKSCTECIKNSSKDKFTNATTNSNNIPTELKAEYSNTSLKTNDLELMKVVQELKDHKNQMAKRVEELERREAAYMETLQQADEIWAEMEGNYKKRISEAEQNEAEMRDKLRKIQKSDKSCQESNSDEFDQELLVRAERLTRENARLINENKRLHKELICCREELTLPKCDEVTPTRPYDFTKEKKKYEEMQQKLIEEKITLQETGKMQSAEIDTIKSKLSRTTNELVHLEVTNGELKEEVDTLELKIAELEIAMRNKAAADEHTICGLTQELNEKNKELAILKQKSMAAEAGERLGLALQNLKKCDICATNINPDLVKTVDGVRTLCHLVSCPPGHHTTEDSQSRRRRFGRWL